VIGPAHSGKDRPTPRAGYLGAILLSAIGHAGLFAVVLFVLPRYLSAEHTALPAYTVKIVDNIPAGNLGTHLPRLDGKKLAPPKAERPSAKPAAAIAAPAPKPTPRARPKPTARPTTTPKRMAAKRMHKRHRAKPRRSPKARSTPDVGQRLARLREQLLKEHLAESSSPASAASAVGKAATGEGPVEASVASVGGGLGIGSGSGSAGVQQDVDFLLYYRAVQQKVKRAWTFSGPPGDLVTTVVFAINPDGSLAEAKITKSSHDSAFDDSVIRALRRAAPFAPPPEKFRREFASGIEALFKLGELSS